MTTPRRDRTESRATRRAAHLAKWLARDWRASAVGNYVLRVRVRGAAVGVTVFPKRGMWAFVVNHSGRPPEFSARLYRTPDAAKLGAFDALTEGV